MANFYLTGKLDKPNRYSLVTDHPLFGALKLIPVGLMVGEPFPFEDGQMLRVGVSMVELISKDGETFEGRCLYDSVEAA